MGAVARVGEAVVLEHMGRAASLWRDRASVVRSRIHDLVSLIHLDDELRANLDGMQAAGRSGWELATQRITWRNPSNAFVMVMMAGLLGDRDRLEATIAGYLREEWLRPALISALGWLPIPFVAPLIDDWLGYHGPRWRALALALSVAHRRDPGRAIDRGLLDDDLEVQRQAVRACGVFRCRALVPTLQALDCAGMPHLRFFVARALVVLRDLDAPERLWQYALEGGEHAEEAAELAVRHVPVPTVQMWLEGAWDQPACRRVAVVAAASTGSLSFVPRLLEALNRPDVAALAGFGLRVILGLDLDASGLAVDPRSDNDPELAYPDAQGVRQWWFEHHGHFARGRRYLFGRPLDVEALREVLLRGPQRVRLLAAHDLYRIRDDHSMPFEIDAPGWRQRRWLDRPAMGRT